ncbi:hypothetical protein MPSEU_000539500 [Mayamaea pseudoterrestris]|nr:hypothetical protein MPSEU_000539500 [Mayamaea pseudoterrestris]
MSSAQRSRIFGSTMNRYTTYLAVFFILLLVAVVFTIESNQKLLMPAQIDDVSLIFAGDLTTQKLASRPIKVAYAVSITSCNSGPYATSLADAAAVLKHSIHRASIHGTLGGRYDYDSFVISYPGAKECSAALEDFGWKVIERPILVNVSEIRGNHMRENVDNTGCCGSKEFIKLEAYTMTDYPIVVHLDLDTLVLKPMDDLFDVMLNTSPTIGADHYKTFIMQHSNKNQTTIPDRVNAFFTYDYNMVTSSTVYKPVQGGLIVVRPDLNVYEAFRQIVLEGDFRSGEERNGIGWGGKVGPFYGGMTFQGIIPYYYDVLHPGQALELNRCVYNQMCDNPREPVAENSTIPGKCLTNETECEDCRARPVNEIVTAHYTICQKPWSCHAHAEESIGHQLCRNLMREWFRVRSEMEISWGRKGLGAGSYEPDIFFGFCRGHGDFSYLPIQQPFGRPLVINSDGHNTTL